MAESKTKKEDTTKGTLSEADILSELLDNLPAQDEVEVVLPSKNKFYSLLSPGSPITIRPMTFEDEKVMMSNKNPNVDIINSLLARCVSNINLSQLLQLDKLYLIMKLREISYGDEYAATIACPGCRKDNKVKFNLSQLKVNYISDDFTNPVELELPVLKKIIKIRLPRVEDEKYFQNSEIALANMWRFVEEIGGYEHKSIISKVVKKLPLKDAHAVLNAINGEGVGIDTRVQFYCSHCNHHEVMELPINADFFTEN